MGLPYKPRGFWDYGLFAIFLAGLLTLLFWVEVGRYGWPDAVFAFLAALFFVFAIILVRRNETAAWIRQPSSPLGLWVSLGMAPFVFGAIYLDAFLLHRNQMPAGRFRINVVVWLVLVFSMLLQFRRSKRALRLRK